MAIAPDTDQERPVSGRFVRNLALSLSGGALLTVLGATAAHAQDAGTASDGTGAAHSGDATAVGNRSGSATTQTGASGAGGSVQVVGQTAAVANVGVAVADTGGNTATGNSSNNTGTATQVGSGGLIATANNGSAANSSNGTATISTGDATAIGNESNTSLSQASGTTGAGALGGILIVSQTGVVLNAGVAQASTGGNTATGNDTDSTASLLQNASAAGLGLATNSGRASNTSNGLATINTGAASATGNRSDTKVTQSSNGDAGDDPGGVLLVTQAGAVINVGMAEAATGDNTATGATTDDHATLSQGAAVDDDVVALLALASNSGDVQNAADGSAHIRTGAATATGNQSTTELAQSAEGTADGVAPIIQAAAVLNAGTATAGTGDNEATGNDSESGATADQTALVGGVGTTTAGQAIASNSAELANTSDGTASISTGSATATGNTSTTDVDQTIDPSGLVLNPQAALVVNAGEATALTGTNVGIGNFSGSQLGVTQLATVGAGDSDVTAGQAIASTSLSGGNTSDGTSSIDTGAAWASGNESTTHLEQTSNGSVDGMGLIVTPQVAVVANLGSADAFTGSNYAPGNDSGNQVGGLASSTVGSAPAGSSLTAASAIASSSVSASSESDGSAEIRTGAAKATGNHSTTELTQVSDASVDGLGAVVAPQVAGVVNLGDATALTGNNTATGNISFSTSGLGLSSQLANPPVAQDLLVVGSATASASGAVSNQSDGHAKIGTGRATAEGNRSTTALHQHQDASVDGLGLIVAPQLGAVANLGEADAVTGENAATGNESTNSVRNSSTASLASGNPAYSGTIIGPATASTSADLSNRSDGEACVCTGDATASGNLSTTTLVQDLDTHVEMGTLVVTEVGAVLNLGDADAETGGNEATGNSSENTAVAMQTSTINDALLPFPVVGPQTASTSLGGGNTSDGTAKIGTGRATAIGNDSTTELSQAAALDGGFAVTSLTGVTANAGLATATTGDNEATGNDSVNFAILTQTADGAGVVSSSGEVRNDSDGTAQIGDPTCEEEAPPAVRPPGLPRTGGPLEAEAAIALMLLLVGFGLTRRSNVLAGA